MEVGDAGELVARIPEILQLEAVQLKSIWHTRKVSGIQCLFPEGVCVDAPLETDVRDYLLGLTKDCPSLGLHPE